MIVAGGSGARFGRPKQFECLRGRRVIDWSIESLRQACGGVVVVVPADAIDDGYERADAVVVGGADRSASVRSGLAALPTDATHVLVHDGARPLATAELAARVVAALAAGAEAVVPVVPVVDSLRTTASEPVDRTGYVAVQTPQGFAVESLRTAHAAGLSATDDATLFHELGVPVVHVDGESTNLKITDPHDLAVAEVLFDAR